MTDPARLSEELKAELLGDVSEETLDAFRQYHRERPHIFRLFKQYAHQMRATGRTRYSAKSIIERIRWDHDIEHPEEEFKISNSFTSLYVRLLIWHEPNFRDFFVLKRLRGLSNPYGPEHYISEDRA